MHSEQIFQKDFRRLKFTGNGKVGTCFLRARINPDGTSVFFCVQLRNYSGASITNAVEEIFTETLTQLHNAGALKLPKPNWYSLRKVLDSDGVRERGRWVEHYPADVSITGKDTYAIVDFDDSFKPDWIYLPLEKIAEECGVGVEFFQVSRSELDYSV